MICVGRPFRPPKELFARGAKTGAATYHAGRVAGKNREEPGKPSAALRALDTDFACGPSPVRVPRRGLGPTAHPAELITPVQKGLTDWGSYDRVKGGCAPKLPATLLTLSRGQVTCPGLAVHYLSSGGQPKSLLDGFSGLQF